MRSNLFRLLPVLFLFVPIVSFAQEVDLDAQPENPGVTLISIDTVWTAGSEQFIDTDIIVSGATLTIEKGVKVKFAPNQDLGVTGLFQIQGGRVIAEGTEAEPIVFTVASLMDAFSFSFDNDGNPDQSLFRYVKIENAGRPKEMAGGDFGEMPGVPALTFNGGNLRIENSSFKGSRDMDIRVTVPYWFGEVSSSLEIVNSNFEYAIPFKRGDNDVPLGNTEAFFAQADIAVDAMGTCPSYASTPCQKTVTLKNNYYGDTTGPDGDIDNAFGGLGEGKKISGITEYSGMRRTNLLADPLILIPGIMGSQQDDDGRWVVDPILHTHDNLIASLQKNGYEEGKNLFLFPYDWKRDNRDTANDLRERIEAIRSQTGSKKVDIVAHSMGGLVARQYIQGDTYRDDVDQLMTLGTPQRGSPKAYLMWEGGEFGVTVLDAVLENHFRIEAEHAGYLTLYQYIQERVPSVQELLPDYDYLYDLGQHGIRAYPENYPRNTFLEELNSEDSILNLQKIRFSKVVGKMNIDKSLAKIRVVGSADSKWINGKPENFDDRNTDRGLEYSDGDRTVPIFSAQAVNADKQEIMTVEHNDLPSEAQCLVLKEFSGRDDCTKVSKINIPNIFLIDVFSPIDIQVISPSGKRMGKDFLNGNILNEIPHAFYTGYQTENEFITIPNPEDGEYRILTEGTGDGEYRIEATQIVEDSEMGDAKESTATIRGIAETGKQEEKSVTIQDGVVTGENADTIAPTTTMTLAGTKGQDDWYTGDVTVTLTATDNESGSGVEKTEYSFDAGVTWNVYADPFVISKEGVTTLQYLSTDKAGNREETRTQEIKIDKTAPEAKITFNKVTQKLDIIGVDNLGGAVNVVTKESVMGERGERGRMGEMGEMGKNERRSEQEKEWEKNERGEKERTILTATLTDPAGHTTVLVFEKKKDRRNRIDLALRSVSYDGVVTNLSNSGIQYKWQMDKRGKYQLLASHLKVSTGILESHYLPKRNETWLMEKPRELDDEGDDDSDRRATRKRLPGMVIPSLTTTQGQLKMGY
jgi:pimeloyl-ACP methyl ester carboxylesterase